MFNKNIVFCPDSLIDDDVSYLVNGLIKYKSEIKIRRLSLSGNYIDTKSMRAILSLLREKEVEELDLSSCFIDAETAFLLALGLSKIQNLKLKLNLRSNKLISEKTLEDIYKVCERLD